MNYFEHIPPIGYRGPECDEPFAFRHYDPDRVLDGKPLRDHLRFAVCYWHNFCWEGTDIFGEGTFLRPWHQLSDPMESARAKMDAAFDFMSLLGVPFWTFHDSDIAPAGESWRATRDNLERMVDYAERKMADTGLRLLWGTANLFSHRRYMAGAATNPDPQVFACAAGQIQKALEITHRLGGENYVMWGGREGYETLLNTDLRREQEQLGRMLCMTVDYKHKLGFDGPILIEPKPQEPTKHQYDYDVATIYGLLTRFGLEGEVKVNIEVNHATLAGHSFHHEIAMAQALGLFGSVDANRGDYQNGWDTDQYPNSVDELVMPCYEILRHGGFTSGGFNFDTKLRRQSVAPEDLFHAHIGAMDILALTWEKAAALLASGSLDDARTARYESWGGELGQPILGGDHDLESLAAVVVRDDLQPEPVSGQQELLENRVNAVIHSR
ncbi:MAG: xylose isomerase [Haliea sp.]|uniref:xylose isomerase n=1 Tax=Haliea sp. TaxID=1932666 RepID=UPI0032EE1DAC